MTIKRLHEKLKPDFYVYVAQEISSRETGCSHVSPSCYGTVMDLLPSSIASSRRRVITIISQTKIIKQIDISNICGQRRVYSISNNTCM